MKSSVYYFFSCLTKLGMPFFFRKLEVIGTENIPQDAPFILVANHQNAFLDAMVASTIVRKPLTFLTRSDIFVAPFQYFLSLLNMWPVYRKRDGYAQLAKNEEIFQNCKDLLKNGSSLLIFPEGNMAPGYQLRALSKGTARLAIQAQSAMSQPLYIVSVGINYFDHNKPRRRFIINVGKVINVSEYMEEYRIHEAKAIVHLRSDMTDALKTIMLLPEKNDNYDSAVDYLLSNKDNSGFDLLKKRLASIDASAPPLKRNPNDLLKAILGLPHWPVLAGVNWLLKNKLKDPQFILSVKFLVSILILPLYWLMLLILIFKISGSIDISLAVLIAIVLMLFIREEF
jgi:1-acyl-sn-glycerol-3-phosphate acyltransferase